MTISRLTRLTILSSVLLTGAGCQTSGPAQSLPTGATRPNPSAPPSAYAPSGTILPAGFPSDIPRYPEGSILDASLDGRTATLAQETPINTEQLSNWVQQQFNALGASQTRRSQVTISTMLTYHKPGVEYRVRIDDNRDGTAALTIVRQGSN